MKKNRILMLAWGVGLSLVLTSEAGRTKFIAAGWDVALATPQQILNQVDEFETLGVDGVEVSFKSVKCADGKVRNFAWGMMSEPMTWEAMSQFLPALSQFKNHAALRESILGFCCTPILCKRLAWTDDAAWARFAANMAIVARLAKESGIKTVQLDPEDYPRARQYYQGANDPPYETCAKLARQRGREIGRAIFETDANLSLMFNWLLSNERDYAHCDDPAGALRAQGDLWFPFIDGILDVLPPTARLIDGDEHGYGYKAERRDFDAAIARHVAEGWLLAPENRVKYRAQASFATGHYLDGFLLKKGAEYYNETTSGSTALQTLATRLRAAARTGDGYIWLWGEHKRYVKWRDLKIPAHLSFMKIAPETWDETYPGFSSALKEIKDPETYLKRHLDRLETDANTTNLLARALAKMNDVWQHPKAHKGKFIAEPGQGAKGSTRIVATGVGSGCVQLSGGSVKPGERIAAEAYSSLGERVSIALRWRKGGKWFKSMTEGFIGTVGAADAEGRHRLIVQGRAPEGADGFSVQIYVRLGDDETATFDRVLASRLSEIGVATTTL